MSPWLGHNKYDLGMTIRVTPSEQNFDEELFTTNVLLLFIFGGSR